MLTDGGEIALVDVRDQGPCGRGHPLLAVNVPLSGIEMTIRRFVPRLSTRIVLCDEDDGLADRAADVLAKAGYGDLAVLDGGVRMWAAAGFELFIGSYTVTNCFGLHVDQRYGTPHISAEQLKAKIDAGEDLVVFDSRPDGEFAAGSIPGGINVPGGELVYRVRDVAPESKTQIIVNCGGKARSTVGSQSLINAGVENPVMALTHGTMGWFLAGHTLDRGATRAAGPVSAPARAWAARAAERIASRFGVTRIEAGQLAAWRREAETRTLYLIDVRSQEEYEAGHLPGSIWVPGGELVGCTEDHIATRNPRICLVDDDGARATMTASWMSQMGWPEVAVLDGGIGGHDLVQGPEIVAIPELETVDAASIPPDLLAERLQSNEALVVDFAASGSHQSGHIPGAWWMLRSALPRLFDRLPPAACYVTTSRGGRVARLAAADMARLTERPVVALDGGTEAWRAAGHELAGGMPRPAGEVDDVYMNFAERPGDDAATIAASYRHTIAWREGLWDQFLRDGTLSFVPPPT